MKRSIFEMLSNFYGSESAWKEVESVLKEERFEIGGDFYEPFKNLIIGILSQNTSDRNSARAYIGLKKKFKEIDPKTLASASEKEIEKAIRLGGLHRVKAKRIKKLAWVVMRKFKGDLRKLLKLPKEEAREKLLELPGIGNKTADVFLAYCGNYDTIPIDTNIARVAKRIGIVSQRAEYAEIQEALIKLIPAQRPRAHELLIRLGRDFCKVSNPLCNKCPVKNICKKII